MDNVPRKVRRQQERERADRLRPADANFGWWFRMKMHDLHIPGPVGKVLLIILLVPIFVVGILLETLRRVGDLFRPVPPIPREPRQRGFRF